MADAETTAHFTGSCLCGAVSYTIDAAPLRVAQCCCADCRKATGTGHITLAFFPADKMTISGELAEFTVTADSGNLNTRMFCPRCGSRLLTRNSAREGVYGVAVGTMDDAGGLQPQAVVYAEQNYGWDLLDGALPKFDKMPPAA